MTAALVAAGLGVMPSTASAAGGPTGPVAPSVVSKAGESALRTFSSPADRTVRTGPPTGGNKAAGDHPGVAVGLDARSHTAHGLELTSKITGPDSALEVVVDWGDGKTEKKTIKGSGELFHSHTYAEVGEYRVKVTATDVAHAISGSNDVMIMTIGSEFTPHAPTRLLDTRDGTGTRAGKVAARGTTRVKVRDNARIPGEVRAVALNVTVTNTSVAGHITAWPGKGTERPDTSNINYVGGQSVPNLVIVPVGTDGYVELYNAGWGAVDLIADVTGYFTRTPSSGYTSLDPVRFVDTREGLGAPRWQLAGQGVFTTQIGGLHGVPKGITAVALNVTVTNPRQLGHLSVFPAGGPVPTASNLNFAAGQTIANAVIVPVSADGDISVFNGAWGPTDVVVDVVGYYSKDSRAAFVPFTPRRMLDTRNPSGWFPGGRLPARGHISQWVSGEAEGDEAYVLNTTVTETTDSGFLSVAPSPFPWLVNDDPNAPKPPRPGSSTLNWTVGGTVPNLVQASAGEHGIINFWNQGWKDADLVVDIFGIYQNN